MIYSLQVKSHHLLTAIEEGQIEIVKILVAHGANVNMNIDNWVRELYILVFQQVILLCSFIIQTGKSLLHLTEEKGQTDVSTFLITHGANMDAKDKVKNL